MSKRAIVLACLFIIAGCVSMPSVNCVVMKQIHNAAWVEHTMSNCDGNWMPMDVEHPDQYFVTVKGDTSYGKSVTWTYFVTSNQFYSVEVGKPWPYHL